MTEGVPFLRIVSKYPLPKDLKQRAKAFWQTWTLSRKSELRNDITSLAVCTLYVASVDKKQQEPNAQDNPTLSQLLAATKTNIVTFFKSMSILQSEQRLSTEVKRAVLAVKKKYCVTVALFRKFETIFSKVFQNEASCAAGNGAISDADEVTHPNRKHTCWALYLLAKGTFLKDCTELVLPLQLLLCCMDYIVRQSPVFMLREKYGASHYSSGNRTSSNQSASLTALCNEAGCGNDTKEVESVYENYLTPFLATIPEDRMTQGLEGLPELEYLQMKYLEIYQQAGDIDEMQFLTSTSNLLPSTMSSSPNSDEPDSTVKTEAKTAVPMTPVKRAITTVQALKTLLSGASDTPSPSLAKYFENCSTNPSSSIQERISQLREGYTEHFTAELGVQSMDVARSRFQLGVRLYYRVMEAMLKREEQRLSTKDFGSLLNNDLFHRSLLGCSLEVVMVTYGYAMSPGMSGGQLLFPWILRVFELKAFDFCKVLESFVRDEPNLTKEAMKHLQSVETQIVEGLAWETGSPLFETIKTIGGNLLMSPTRPPPGTLATGHNGVSISKTTAADMYLSPMRPMKSNRNLPTLPPSTLGSPPSSADPQSSTQPSPSKSSNQSSLMPRPTRSVSLNIFYNKVLQLAYGRLQSLCRLLRVNSELERYIWTCVQHCVTVKPDLLRDRHLDQLTMCSLYAICKVADNELKFKDIVNVYRTMPHAQANTYKLVRISDNQRDSIIVFYNVVFMPEMKNYILRFQPKKATPSLSPVPARCQSLFRSPGNKTPLSKNLYISPMKDSPFKSPQPVRGVLSPPGVHITPRKRTMYSFGEGPGSSEKLREINDHMREANSNSPHNTRSSTSKRLKFEMLDGPDMDDDMPPAEPEQSGLRSSPIDPSVSSTNGHSKSPDPNSNGNHKDIEMASPLMHRRMSQLNSAMQNSK
ncbi:LOW QUALITY PROTEIN: retinoblastoma-associated protein-like [Amphiura filiformis]|uniref:LOW QUALITY PROTEIN: retinoblastoma-associated protein-like n=1 Tax=Amphiura filiformis TaxID=82378 RepID=UPI003B20D6D4